MAVLTKTTTQGVGARTATVTVASASDTFAFSKGTSQILILNNITAGALTPNLVGSAATDVGVPGYGTLDVSGGYTTPSVAAGAQVVIPLDSISSFLTGEVTVTGADGMEVVLLG